jgi:predicted DsbA family dithiol-disulfide isomerase
MAGLAYRFAMASDKVTVEVYDVSEFSSVAQKYAVGPVPTTIINEKTQLVGAVPEQQLLAKVMEAVAR